ncbi:hypothetical protein HQ325_03870 [Rhodococcus sp. BP-349]|uniref:linalool dehydratase/isomerase domain-containing protein n=1 Tax=unclassified Rhodococcus (in: high G+C Gram-positive bacteria) TaxID=192944 RepID=UPI001C9B214A|nr:MULTISPECIES: hypothetical protein [unclassified Rhodococcus (in: high G+C Gram-positive bacteria)]MBY6537802.1 hypothetical protein [Rhodococcus sp. BP-363]MBY6542139.1 hypothetical protein [Rhodococcus sp. BP-369]MBY6561369.1 hypothetical protein [Rhodococcus sp. BP-370]MBY6575661.1 hypothetical protein [Rhodococcus sp. BP-364]MBY6584962.1 hypothetical protein [Rhodococcus sp. BP-358]
MKNKRNKQRGGASRAVVAGLAIVPLAARLIDRPKAIGEESVPPFDGGTHRDVVHSTSITIPPRDFRSGPLTRKRQARAFAILGAMEAVGLVLAAAGKSPRMRAAGLGLMVPGGGDLLNKEPVRGAAAAGSSALGLVLWIGSGNHLVTPLAWLGSAALSARRAEGRGQAGFVRCAVPLAVGGAVAGMAIRLKKDFEKQKATALETNQYLEDFEPPLRGDDRPEPFVGQELSKDELLFARHLLGIALQDADNWDNYDIMEQFQPTAIRYQLNWLGWALSALQYSRMPAFHGYLSEAQRRLIEKFQQRKVWSYWWLENLWGNLESNPDPVRKQNVMLSGFFGLQLSTYQSATGDMRYAEPGSVKFHWDRKRTYEYSLPSICDAMARDIDASEWGMIVCEPNWLYPYCNSVGANAFKIQDRMTGSDYWPSLQGRFTRTADEELHRPDGLVMHFKSTRTGYGNGALPTTSVEFRPLIPDLADRGWALLKAGVWLTDDDGKVSGTVFRDMPKGLDYGNAGASKVGMYGSVMHAAREAGDEERASVAWNELLEVANPVRTRESLEFTGASVMSKANVAMGAFGRKGGWLDLIDRGLPETWATGPILKDVPFADAMVARAETDGQALDLVLHPVDDEAHTRLTLARLTPGISYEVTGDVTASVVADENGEAVMPVHLAGRTAINVRPTDTKTNAR